VLLGGEQHSAALQRNGSRARWLLAWRGEAAGAVDGREVKPPVGVRSRFRIALNESRVSLL
jgi:hypothetical protein